MQRPRRFQLVAVAASAGGLSALTTVFSRLPREFPLPIVVVQHLDPNHVSFIAKILARRTALRVKEAEAHEVLHAGAIYVAPPALHTLVAAGGAIRLTGTEKVHFVRPSADRLFESAAAAFGPVIAVILTGTGRDGASGAAAIRKAGGVVIAQNETTSEFFGMPHAAIEDGAVDYVLPLEDIGATIVDLAESECHD